MRHVEAARRRGAWYLVLAGVGTLAQPACRGSTARVDAAAAGPVDAAPHAEVTALATGDGAASATASHADGAVPADRGPGDWLDGTIYRFRVRSVRPCGDAAEGAGRIAVRVEIVSKIRDLLVAPRDVHLKAGGVILDSATVISSAIARQCGMPLGPRSLRAGKSAEGIVIFDVPPGFAQGASERVQVTYQPTRWGGAHAVSAILPSDGPIAPAH